MITQQEENLLIDGILAGNRESYGVLVDEYKSFAFTIAMKIVNNRSDAEEIAQDAFIKAFHYLKSFNKQAKFSTWLYRIVFNTAISFHRKTKHHFQTIEDSIIEHPAVNNELEKNDQQRYISQALARLNGPDRMALQLFYMKEFSLEEVASIMEQNAATVKVRIHRARQRLAEELKKILKQEALTL